MQLCEQSPSRGLVLPGRCLEAPQPCSVLQARHDFSIGTRVTPQVSIFLGFRPSEDQLQDPKEDNLAPLPELGKVNEDEETTEAAAEASRPRLRGMDGFGVLAVGRAFKRNVHRLSAALEEAGVPLGHTGKLLRHLSARVPQGVAGVGLQAVPPSPAIGLRLASPAAMTTTTLRL